MTEGKASFVCFDCRQILRRARGAVPVRCSRCGEMARFAGYKLRFPKRGDVAGWSRLRELIAKAAREEEADAARARVRARHALERRLKELEARPSSKDREREIRELRRRIEAAP
ncbi:MAG TPA: hypothetical protein VF950_26155 [Planctomycetota bacterium]